MLPITAHSTFDFENERQIFLSMVSGVFLLASLGTLLYTKKLPRMSKRYARSKQIRKALFRTNHKLEHFIQIWENHLSELEFAEQNLEACELGVGPISMYDHNYSLYYLSIYCASGPRGSLSGASATLDDRTRVTAYSEIESASSTPIYGTRDGVSQIISSDVSFRSTLHEERTGYAYAQIVGPEIAQGTLSFTDPEIALDFVNEFNALAANYDANLANLSEHTEIASANLQKLRNISPRNFGAAEIQTEIAEFAQEDWHSFFGEKIDRFINYTGTR